MQGAALGRYPPPQLNFRHVGQGAIAFSHPCDVTTRYVRKHSMIKKHCKGSEHGAFPLRIGCLPLGHGDLLGSHVH